MPLRPARVGGDVLLTAKHQRPAQLIQWPEEAFDAEDVAHAKLDVILGGKSRTLVQLFAFQKHSANGIKRLFAIVLAVCVEEANYRAIEPAKEKIAAAGVCWQWSSRLLGGLYQTIVSLPHHHDESAIEKVQAVAQINNRANHRRLFDPLPGIVWPVTDFAGELVRSAGVVLPEINTITEPVIVVTAWLNGSIARKNMLSHLAVAAVVSQDKACGGRIHDLAEVLRQANAIWRTGVFLQDARFHEICASFLRRI